MKDTNKEILFYDYLSGEMNEKERSDFEQLLSKNPELAEDFEKHKDLNNIMFDAALLDVKKELQQIHKNKKQTNKGKGKWLFSMLAILGFIASYFAFFASDSSSKTENKQENPTQIEARSSATVPQNINQTSQNSNKKESLNESKIENETENADDFQLDLASKTTRSVTQEEPKTNLSSNKDDLNQLEEVLPYIEQKQKLKKESKKLLITNSEKTSKEESLNKTQSLNNEVEIAKKEAMKFEFSNKMEREYEGKITFKNVSNGKAPFEYCIEQNEFSSQEVFSGLNSGYYQLQVKDANGQISKIQEVLLCCDIFIPQRQHQWALPLKEQLSGELLIVDSRGATVVSEKFKNQVFFEWNREILPKMNTLSENFTYIVKYSNGEMFTGSVTIVQ